MKWTPEVDAALQDFKTYLYSVPTLVSPKPQEPLFLFLAATNQVVSVALVAQREVEEAVTSTSAPSRGEDEHSPARSDTVQDREEQGSVDSPKDAVRKKAVQFPLYFVSSLLQGARLIYSSVQKLIFGLIMASRKLRHYFQAHEITVVTRFLLQRIFRNPEATGRIVEWALELSSFGLKFESTSTVYSRALAAFIAEWTPTPDEELTETVVQGKESPQNGLCILMVPFPYKVRGLACFFLPPPGST